MVYSEITTRYLPVTAGRPFVVHEADSSVTPLVDGEEYFLAVRMEMGRTSGPGDAIYLLGWRFESDFRFNPDPQDISRLGPVLAEKAAAGVDVRLIMSAKWQLLNHLQAHTEKEIHDLKNGDLDNVLRWFGPNGNIRHARQFRTLDGPGVKAPLAARVLLDYRGEVTGIHHQKAVVVIRGGVACAFLGGLDFLGDRLDNARHAAKLPRPNPSQPGEALPSYWHDAGVRVDGPAALDVLNVFRTRWLACARQTPRGFTLLDGTRLLPSLNPLIEPSPLVRPKSVVAPPVPLRGVFVAVNFPERDVPDREPLAEAADPSYGGWHTTGVLYGRAIRGARRYIYVEDQYVTAPDSLFPVLAEAIKRGVRFIAVLGGHDDDTQRAVETTLPAGALKDFLASLGPTRAGAKVFHLQQTIVHSKLMIIDDQFFAIGSANFSDRSMMEAKDDRPLGRLFNSGGRTIGATDSELHVGVVDDRDGPANAAAALRIQLWAEHLRVDQWDPQVRADLANVSRALSVFSPQWGPPVRFKHPESRLVEAR